MEKLNHILLNRVAIITGGTRGIGLVSPGFWVGQELKWPWFIVQIIREL
jgi:hypothetical protein